MNEPITITLVCWSCGKSMDAQVPRLPMFAFEIAGWANDVGMAGYIDHQHGRSLVFCDERCAKDQMTRAGSFRARPKRFKEPTP